MHRAALCVLAAFAASLSSCQKAPGPPAAPRTPAVLPAHGSAPASRLEGWETDVIAFGLGGPVPDFALDKVGGGRVSKDDLRGRWTILGFWNATIAGIEDEAHFIRALNSAVDQDPDLDLLTVYLKLDAAETNVAKCFANNGGDPWPTLVDKGEAAGLFRLDKTPGYLLVGPDLTIEAWRGALHETPEDGVKSVIRGVAQIRKQTAAPQ